MTAKDLQIKVLSFTNYVFFKGNRLLFASGTHNNVE